MESKLVIERYLHTTLLEHLSSFRQMAFLSGPRQVGKTTLSRNVASEFPISNYFNWDNIEHRESILQGLQGVVSTMNLDRASKENAIAVFDEIHKYTHWRDFLKDLYDTHPLFRAVVTGSASLTVFNRGGDSLRGRFFLYHLHPLSVAELNESFQEPESLLNLEPKKLPQDRWETLLRFGGFPDPFFNSSQSFSQRWIANAREQLIREEIRDLTRVQELSQIELLAIQIRHQVGQLSSYSTFSRTTRSSVDTYPALDQHSRVSLLLFSNLAVVYERC